MKKWEYRIIDTQEVPGGGIFGGKSRQAVEAYLNELGEQGWQIVNCDALEWKSCGAFRGVATRMPKPTRRNDRLWSAASWATTGLKLIDAGAVLVYSKTL